MTSAFDSEVYAERQRLAGVTVSIPKLLSALLWQSDAEQQGCAPASVTVEYRADVDTSMWWTVRWGKDQLVAATTLELALFRAAVLARKDDERAQRYAGQNPPAAPAGEM